MSETNFEYETLAGIKEEFEVLRQELIEKNPEIDESDEIIVAIDNLIQEIDSVDGELNFTLSKKVTIKALTFFVGQSLGFDESFDDEDLDIGDLEAFLSGFSSFEFDEKDKELLFMDDEKEFLLELDEDEDHESKTKPIESSDKKKKSDKKSPSEHKKKPGSKS
jgi:hypothetical protein